MAGTAWDLTVPTLDQVNLTVAPEFDAGYYVVTYPDVAASGMDPLQHFVLHGAAELRNPNRWFDLRYYVLSNPDVMAMGVNGLWHYIVQGRAQGRAPRRGREGERRAFEAARPPAHRFPKLQPVEMACLAPASLLRALRPPLTQARGVILSVSHDRYTRSVGGVQILVSDEQHAYNARGEAYLHIAPARPRLVLADPDAAPFYVHATLDGVYVGVTTYGDLAQALATLGPALPQARRLVLHCLLGHQAAPMAALHQALGAPPAVFWLNDYESACVGFNLLRNDAAFCGGPPVGSHACRVCVYGPDRAEHLRQMRALFAAVPFHVVAPSAAALAVWHGATDLPHLSAEVHAYAAIEPAGLAPPRAPGPVRVAFVGYPVANKGWPAFAELAARLDGLAAFRLFHFVAAPPDERLPGVEIVPARVLPGDRGAMTEALRAHAIDLVLVLSPWPETFCLVAYEALAAGADVITLAAAGNVPDMVLSTGRGLVMDTPEDVTEFFLSNEAVRYVEHCGTAGQPVGRLVSRGMTATLPLDAA